MIHVIATIEAAPGKLAEFLGEFRRIVPTVREEAGCLEYGPTVDIETDLEVVQARRADTVTVVEKWENLEALEAHLNAPHMLEYRQKVRDLVEAARVHVTRPA